MGTLKKRITEASHKEEFIKIFDSLCYRHPKFTVWSDFVHMAAYSISNACDYRQEREDKYLNIVKRYSKDDVDKLIQLFVHTVMGLEANRQQDFLGQLYMEYGFGDNRKGEYFTPYHIAEMMAKVTGSEKSVNENYITVNDPTCGSGVMLIAYANSLLESGRNHHFEMLTVATDIDPCIALMCYIQLSLLGCAGYVCIRNTLTEPITGNVLFPPKDAFVMPLFLHPIWRTRQMIRNLNTLTKGVAHEQS